MSLGIGFDSSSMLVGPGLLVEGEAPAPLHADPNKEYVAAPANRANWELEPYSAYSPFLRRQPLHILRAMQLAPAVSSSIAALKAGVLSGGFTFTPAVRDKPADDDDAEAAEANRAKEECLHSAFRLDRPLETWAWEMLDAMAEGHKLSEVVMETVAGGPFAGSYALKALKVKPRWSYRFRVDAAMNVDAIECYTVDGAWQAIEPSHFCWLTWGEECGDPRGRSILDAAFAAFNMLMRLWPEFQKGNERFGTPSLFITTSPQSKPMVAPRDARNAEIPGARPVTAEYAAARQGEALRNGATVAMPPDATATVIESARDGVGINSAIGILESQIVRAILLQVRATMEARHGSKADSETGQDILGTYLRYIRPLLCQPVRMVFRQLLAANHGEEYARLYTPHVGLGRIEPQDFAAFATAIAVLYQAGYFAESQLVELDALLNIAQRRDGEPRVGPQADLARAAIPGPAPDQKAVAEALAVVAGFVSNLRAGVAS